MAERFNADEVFEIAEQIERNGEKFYRRSAQVVDREGARGLLLELADMEARHERIFAAMREDLWKQNPEWLAKTFNVDGENEAALYLRAVAAGQVFDLKADPAAALPDTASLVSILKIAIGLEKDSIVYYLGVKDVVPQDLGGDKIAQILREEMSHVTMLSAQLADAAS